MNFGKNLLLSSLLTLFSFGNAFATDLYWVGNNGNWNDASHWASTSGGVGGIGIPTQNDDVFFDGKSFNKQGTISILNSANCKNFIWNTIKNVTLKSPTTSNLTVSGSFSCNDNLNNQLYGKTIFTSNQNQTSLYFDRIEFLGDIEFNGSGSWTLNSDLNLSNKSITLKKGSLLSNGQKIIAGSIDAKSNKPRKLDISNSQVIISRKWDFSNNLNLNFISNKNSFVIIEETTPEANIILGNIDYSQFNFVNKKATCASIIPFYFSTINVSDYNGSQVTCIDSCDGTLSVVIDSGGVGPFGFQWIGGPNDSLWTGVCQGSYNVIVYDSGQALVPCVSPNITVNEPSKITSLQLIYDEPTCNADCDGVISVLAFGGVGGYIYTWANNPGNPTSTDSNLCSGLQPLNITDDNGCEFDSTFILTEPDIITFTLDSTNINCFGNCNGDASVSGEAGGNGAPYTYLWSSPPGGSGNSISNLCVGTYVVTVSDDSLCFTQDSVTITEIPQIQIDTSTSPVNCGGTCTGEITTTISSGGNAPFTHNWSNGFSSAGLISTNPNLCAGPYCDTIVDGFGCDTIICFTITEPDTLLTTTNISDVICNGDCDGTAITIPRGGTPAVGGYVFAWDSIPTGGPFNGQGTDSISDLCPGTYFVTITDDNNCSVSDTISIIEPDLLIANASKTDITCPGFNDGTATVTPTGGNGTIASFTFNWTGPPCNPGPFNTQSISSLCAGNYIITVTDSLGCIAIDNVTIEEPDLLNLTMTVTPESCAGDCDGTSGVTVTGGTPATTGYTFLWTSVLATPIPNGQGTDSIFGLCPDDYTVIVTDSLGCSGNQLITVLPSTPIAANLVTNGETCNGECDGNATISPTGTGPYTVVWDGNVAGIVGPGTGPFTINTLCEGPHTALITDGNGCDSLVNFNLIAPPIITSLPTTTDISCFGLCDGTATTTAGGGSGTLDYNWTAITGTGPITIAQGQGTDSIFNICDGTYFVTITDDSLCTLNDTIEIFEPIEILPNATFTNITCNSLNNGTAIATPTGGVPAYASITWSSLPLLTPIPGNGIGPLSAGEYQVIVTDSKGCTGIDTVEIIEPDTLTVSATATNASCQTLCDGSALATPTGGTPSTLGYTYVWTVTGPPSQNTQTAIGLCAGQYEVTVTDSMGCIAKDTTVILPLITIQITPTIVGISCNGLCDGTASAIVTGGLAPYSYQWSGNSAGLNDTLIMVDSLCPGWVYVTVTDADGCVSVDSVNMPISPPVLVPNGQIDQEISCFGECDAMVSHNPSGGTAPYTSVWTLPTGVDTNNVCPTLAIITVTDSLGCIESDTLRIIEPLEISPNDVVVDVLCFGDSTGSITLNPSGGAGGTYFYTWTGPMPGSGISTGGLMAGIYTITVTDSNGCDTTVTDTIVQPPVLSSVPVGIDISCNGLCDGMMTVIVNGGFGQYTYQWANNQPLVAPFDTISGICSVPISNLTNSVEITDDNGCRVNQIVTINEPLALNANVSGTNIGCSSLLCDGSALSTPVGGLPGYSYLWATTVIPAPINLTDPNLSNLCIGSYFVTVTDTNGCTDTATYTVTTPQPLNITLDSTNVTCNGDCNGTGTATPTSGTAPFNYLWVGAGLTAADTNATVGNLCPGVYTLTVTDSNNCSFIGSVIITEPLPIDDNEVIVQANCGVNDGSIVMFPSGGTAPYSHSWDTGNPADTNAALVNLGASFYTDTITDSRGCISFFTIAITNPAGPSGVTASVNDATCFGSCTGSFNVIVVGGTPSFTYAWTGPGGFVGTDTTHSNLCAGTYNLLVTDAAGCILATSLVIGEADSIIGNSTFTNTSCTGTCDGTASVTPTGGTAPYAFLWASNSSTGSSISGLCNGADSVTITDFYGCTKVVAFNIGSPNSLSVNSNLTLPTCNGDCDGIATANPLGGTAPYDYQWNDPSSQTTQSATGLCAGTYIVTVTDFYGCSENDTVTITEPTNIVANDITTNSTCGNSDGTANVCASSGGTGTHTYFWVNIPGPVTTCNVAGLPAGAYIVEITDQNSCMEQFVITISDATGPIVNVNSTNASCDGDCDGTATASASGTPIFSYLWTTPTSPPATPPTTNSISGLCAGNYAVKVTDGNGCITTEPITITDNNPISATVSTIEPTCNGDCDGSVLVTPSGGIPPYRYNWSGGNATGQTINAIGGLCAGNYTVTITDFAGCTFPQNVTINEPTILTVSLAGISANCNGSCDGQATATPFGGTAPYTYAWSTGATTPTITALCAATYSVVITDFKGCKANRNVIIGDGVAITTAIIKVDAICGQCDGSITTVAGGGAGGPYTYLWSPGGQTSTTLNNLCPGAYQVVITDNLGCSEPFNILINNANGPALTTLADSVTCFGSCDGLAYTNITAGISPFIYQWDDPNLQITDSAIALCPGLYNIVVQDSAGCISVDSVTVLAPQEILTNITSTDPLCPLTCDGTATITPTGGVGSYTISWNGGAGIPLAVGGSNTINSLCAGTHTILITDSEGCTKLDSITLIDPTAVSITLSSAPPTCNGDCDGTAIANASGGTPGYQYSWNTIPIQNNSLIGSLCAAQYIVTVTDDNGCIVQDSVQVIDPLVLTTMSTPTTPSCNGVCDGSITTSPNGGVAPYSYIWSNGDTTQTTSFTLCDGTYDVIIIDAQNCTVSDTIILIAPTTINDSTVITPPTCNLCDGSATSTPIGGSGTYSFNWTNLTAPAYTYNDLNFSTSTAIGLCAGSYNLEITDSASGCIEDFTVIVNNATGPTLALTATDETCPNLCDGTATAIPTGGTAPYSYSWTPSIPPTDTLQTATRLCAGLYTVNVTDSNNCITSDTISINTNRLNLTITSAIPETCFGDCDGSATVSVTGGTPAYSYTWSPTSPTDTNNTAINLCVGNYTVIVTDSISCSDSISTNITGPDSLTVTASLSSAVSCNGLSDGAAIANVLGGNPNYLYSWNTFPIQNSQIATGLSAGTYIITITDDKGCTAIDSIILTESPAIVDNSILVLPNCGICDGSITVASTGGSGTHSYIWTTPGSPPILPQAVTATIINLCAGAYILQITDTAGCIANFNYSLSNTNAPDPNTTVTNISCNGLCDGKITSSPTQTNPANPYSFLWSLGIPNNLDSITNLCAGPYSLTVTDTNGCIGVAIDSVTQPDILQANLFTTNPLCGEVCDGIVVSYTTGGTAPYPSYTWTSNPINQVTTGQSTDSISSLCAGTYILEITDSNGCTVSDSATITAPITLTASSTQIDASCSINCDGTATIISSGGTGTITFQWNGNTLPGQTNIETGLCYGVNTVIITDQNNCSIIDTINIGATDTVIANAGLDTSYCFGTTIDLNGVPGGTFTNVEWFELPSMNSLGTTDSITTLFPTVGTACYAFQVTGACIITDTVCITIDPLPVVDAGVDVWIFESDNTTLNATGGTSYSWTPSTGLSDSSVFNPVASPEITTTYYVTVTNGNGCSAIDSVIITVLPKINFPSGISPNGDGSNDLWVIDLIDLFPKNVVEIYNRWGELLFHADGYQQDWDGTYKGKELPIGTYYYIIDLNDENFKPFTGPLTILR